MKLSNTRSKTLNFKWVLPLIISAALLSSCNSETDCSKCPTPNVVQPPPCPAGKLYVLELSHTDYGLLKTAAGPGNASHLVVQFTYDKSNAKPLSLIAYATRPGNRFQANPPNPVHPLVSRELTAVSEAVGPFPDKFVLGDQQISIGLIDALLTGAGNPATYTLTFTPEINGVTNNIRFKICVKNPNYCPGAGTYTQPSPPANAD